MYYIEPIYTTNMSDIDVGALMPLI